MSYNNIFNPTILLKNINKLLVPNLVLAFIILVLGFYYSLFLTPIDYNQGIVYKIIFLHVPSAWLASLNYLVLTIFSLLFLIKKHPLNYIVASIFVKLGIIFTFLTLLTGILWGMPTWGTGWVWDARLTSVLILFFIYLGYIVLETSFLYSNKKANIVSIYAIVGFINIPIIKFSVDWWNTLHQASSITQNQTSLHDSILLPLFFMFFSFILYSSFLFLLLLRFELLKRHLKAFYINLTNNY